LLLADPLVPSLPPDLLAPVHPPARLPRSHLWLPLDLPDPLDLVVQQGPPDLEVLEVPVSRCKPDRAGSPSSREDDRQPWQG
jgi:hypothetical protein